MRNPVTPVYEIRAFATHDVDRVTLLAAQEQIPPSGPNDKLKGEALQ